MMKRILAALCAICMLFCLSACGVDEPIPTNETMGATDGRVDLDGYEEALEIYIGVLMGTDPVAAEKLMPENAWIVREDSGGTGKSESIRLIMNYSDFIYRALSLGAQTDFTVTVEEAEAEPVSAQEHALVATVIQFLGLSSSENVYGVCNVRYSIRFSTGERNELTVQMVRIEDRWYPVVYSVQGNRVEFTFALEVIIDEAAVMEDQMDMDSIFGDLFQ